MPISLVGTCAAMYAFDFSINNMTLLALTLSVGFVVDDAIVMLENIVRHIEGGMRPFEAALKGSREIGFTIVSITFSLIAVFIPVLLMGGIVGRVFREFAVTIAVAIVLSGFVSLTLTPMLCARVLRGHHERRERSRSSCCACSSAPSRVWLNGYEWALDRVMAYKSVMLVITLRTIVGTVWLYIVVPKGFFPQRRHRLHAGDHRGAVGHFVRRHGRAPAQDRRDHARTTRRSLTSTRRSASAAPTPRSTTAACSIALKPKSERGPLATRCSRGCAGRPAAVTGMAVYFQVMQNINVGGRINKGEYPVHAAIERHRHAVQDRA